MANPVFAGPLDMFIPEFSGRMTGFIREQGRFKLTEYAQMFGSKDTDREGKPIATYFKLNPDDAVRVGSLNDFHWAPGTRSPSAKIQISGQFVTVQMEREAYPYEYSLQTKKSADIDIGSIYRQTAASVAMTCKTLRISNLLDTASKWGTNTADVNTLNGGAGTWKNASADEQSPNFNAIKKSLTAAMQSVNLKTNAVVQPSQLCLVIAPELAGDMANSGEISSYLKGSPFAREVQEGANDFDDMWNLPKRYNGVKMVVEDAVIDQERPTASLAAATVNRKRIKSPNTAWLLSRPGKLDGTYGAPSFSTLQIFYYRFEMAVMEKSDSWHDLAEGKVVDQFHEELAAPISGYLLTNCR